MTQSVWRTVKWRSVNLSAMLMLLTLPCSPEDTSKSGRKKMTVNQHFSHRIFLAFLSPFIPCEGWKEIKWAIKLYLGEAPSISKLVGGERTSSGHKQPSGLPAGAPFNLMARRARQWRTEEEGKPGPPCDPAAPACFHTHSELHDITEEGPHTML